MSARDPLDTYIDIPISDPSEDRLERAEFAAQLADRIEKASGGPSVVFGLAGPWGSGKSSVLKMVQSDIEAKQAGWEVRWFTPWATSGPDSLMVEFYATIRSALPTTLKDRARGLLSPTVSVFAGAAKALPFAGEAAEAAVQALGNALDDPDSFHDRFHGFSEALSKQHTRVLVIVDDLDRLDANELLAVLKTVRLLGSFPGIHYLLAYDQTTISDVLSTTAIAGGESRRALEYIEKIVQYPFELPPLQRIHRYREVHAALTATASKAGIDLSSLEVDNLPLPQAFLDQIPESDLMTLRSIHRLNHQFDVSLTSIGPENVCFTDLLLLTFLRVNYPDLYRQLPRWKTDLTRPTQLVLRTGNGPVKPWKTMIDATFPTNMAEQDRDQIFDLLRYLFPAVSEVNSLPYFTSHPTDHRRVSERDYFDWYFAFAVTEGDLGDAAVRVGLSLLASEGALPPGDELSVALGDYRQRRAVKTVHQVVRQIPFTAEKALAAAIWLTAKLRLPDAQDPWQSIKARLVADLLFLAIDRAAEDSQARDLVDQYHNRFELSLTSMMIASLENTGLVNQAVNDRRDAALAGHRDRQYETCVRDLREDLPVGSGGILFHCRLLDSATYERLRDHVRATVTTWDGLIRLSARFVGIAEGPNGCTIAAVYLDDLQNLLESARWPQPRPDIDTTAPIDHDDVSLNNRIRIAELVLAEVLTEQSTQRLPA